MDKKKSESDDDYWGSAHKGFDFEEDWQFSHGSSKLSASMRKNDSLNQFDLLRCDGLNEIADNKAAEKSLPVHISSPDEDKHAKKFAQNHNPLELRLKKNVQTTKSASVTIRNMILGLEYSLEPFKGKEEKVELLNAAVKSHDGNSILAVILFLRSTLKKLIFQREIVMFPDAINVYLSYLEEDHETDELANMLLLLDKAEDAAMMKYEAAVTVKHPERKLKWIENCFSTHFQMGNIDPFLSVSVAEHRRLLEEQICLEKFHSEQKTMEHDAFHLFEELTGKNCLVDSSVMCSLICCCLYYYNSTELNYTSPAFVKSHYNVSKKQYTWAAVRALAVTKRWKDIDDLFVSKNWLGGVKMKSCIRFPRILEILSKAKAPNEVLSKYVCCVEDEDLKLILSKKYKCHSVVIEILKNNKDRLALIEYKASLPPHSVYFCTASDILKSSVIKWRN